MQFLQFSRSDKPQPGYQASGFTTLNPAQVRQPKHNLNMYSAPNAYENTPPPMQPMQPIQPETQQGISYQQQRPAQHGWNDPPVNIFGSASPAPTGKPNKRSMRAPVSVAASTYMQSPQPVNFNGSAVPANPTAPSFSYGTPTMSGTPSIPMQPVQPLQPDFYNQNQNGYGQFGDYGYSNGASFDQPQPISQSHQPPILQSQIPQALPQIPQPMTQIPQPQIPQPISQIQQAQPQVQQMQAHYQPHHASYQPNAPNSLHNQTATPPLIGPPPMSLPPRGSNETPVPASQHSAPSPGPAPSLEGAEGQIVDVCKQTIDLCKEKAVDVRS